MNQKQKEHLAYWRGFNLAVMSIINTLENYNFEFGEFTSYDKVLSEIREAIDSEISILRMGD